MRTAADWMGPDPDHADVHDRAHAGPVAARALGIDRWALHQIHRRLNTPTIRLALWDGQGVGAPAADARATVTLEDRPTLYGLLWDAEMVFGDGYSDGRLQVSGDLVHLLEVAYVSAARSGTSWTGLAVNTLHRSRQNVHAHYDLGNDFYRLWLDDQLVYSCAYYPDADLTLEVAQVAKMDLVCRKLELRPGLRVVEAGCGWGALALHMARHYGVTVKAYNISHEQIAYARDRARQEGLTDRVEFIEDDYRSISGRFDRFVSVGMLEHVGLARYGALGEVIDRVLDRTEGRGLLHFIGRNTPQPLSRWITRRIFPGAYPPTLAEATSRVLEPFRLSVLDVENLRLHYARTLQDWWARFEAAYPQIASIYGERFGRAWRLYLAGSMVAFLTGSLQLFQVTFAPERDNTVPPTRAALYETPLASSS
jgi:cyclopropane-fatty-acyl-phospholipid synthase